MSIGSFSVRNPVLINILMVTLLILGVLSVVRLPKEQFSEVPFYWANIIVPYPGVSAEDVEETVTVRIEEQYTDIDKLSRIQSITSEGLAVVRIEFEDGINQDTFERLFQEVQTRFNQVDLPDGVRDPQIDDFSAADFLPVIEVVLSGEVDYATLNEKGRRLEDLLQDVEDVGSIESVGIRDRKIMVNADPARMNALGVSIDEVVQAVQGRNTTIPGGNLSTPTREYLLRTVGKLKGTEEFGRVIVRTSRGAGSGVIQVDDLAAVREVYEEEGARARFNGEPAINLKISKVSGGNSLDVTRGVKQTLEEFRSELPEGMTVTVFNDSTVQIRDSISTLLSNFLFGLLLVILILFLFIGLRNALITALGIPVTFAITFLLLEYMGESLNTNTLFGLVLVLGLIVDHAIVIIENSYRLQQEGLSKIDAAIEGSNQVVIPVIAATATTVAAFLPLMILPGTIGKFLRVIPLTVSVALIASTFEALVFLPAHFADWSGKAREKGKALFDRFRERYSRLLEAVYQRRKRALAVMLLITVGGLSLITTVRQDLFSAEDFSLFYIDIELPPGSPREKTNDVVRRFEEELVPLVGNGEVTAINSSVGFSGSGSGNTVKGNLAQIIVDLKEKDRGRSRSIDAIIREVQERTGDIPGAESIRYRKATNGPPTGPPVSFRIRGDDYQKLIDVSRLIQERLQSYSELYNIRDDVEGGTPELQVRVDEAAAARYGLSTALVGRYIRSAFEGVEATTIFRENREIEVVVRYAEGRIDSVRRLKQLTIPTPDGRQVPFTNVCSVRQTTGVASIQRIDGKRQVTVSAEAYDESRIRTINSEIKEYYQQEIAPGTTGVQLVVGGEFSELDDLLIQILQIFLIGIFLIYVILGTQFKSYGQPFLILFAVPFSFVGIVLYLVLSGTPFSTTVMYAAVALAGIAVNDSIVLISFINDLREKNYATKDAVIRASVTRLRPIILTSVTTIGGLLPTAIGIGGRSVVWGPMASTIIFGLLFSTLTALLLVPCLYGLFDDLKVGRQRRTELRRQRQQA
jgi:multidrug efflux pump subunit AcrB